MSGGGGTNTTTTTQSAEPWSGIQPALGELYSGALQNYFSGGPQYYPGSTVVNQSPNTLNSYSLLQQRALSGSPLIDAAQQQAQQTLGGDYLWNPASTSLYNFSGSDLSPYYSGLSGFNQQAFETLSPQIWSLSGMAGQQTGADQAISGLSNLGTGQLPATSGLQSFLGQTATGVPGSSALSNFTGTNPYASQLQSFQPTNTAYNQLGNFNPQNISLGSLQNFQGSTAGMSGLSGFNASNPLAMMGLLGTTGQTGNLPGSSTLQNIASGGMLNSNPYLDAMFNQAAGRVGEQFQEITMPGIASMFSGAGRYGSNAMQNAVENQQDVLGQTLSNLGTDIYGQNYANERAFQQQALQQLGSQGLAGIGLQQNAFGQMGQLGLGISGQQLGALQALNQAGLGASGQNLSALQSAGQLGLGLSEQQLSALQAQGQLGLGMSGQQLQALQSLGDMGTAGSAQRLAAIQSLQQGGLQFSAQQLQALQQMDQSQLQQLATQQQALSSAGQLGLQGDAQSLAAMQASGQLAGQLSGQQLQSYQALANSGLQGLGLQQTALSNLGEMYARERAMQMSMLGMAPQLAQQDYFDINQLGQLGSMQEAYQQQLLNAQMNAYNYNQQLPTQNLQTLSQLLQGGLNFNTTSGSTSTPYQTNPLLGALGGGMMGQQVGTALDPGWGTWGSALGAIYGGLFG